MLRLNFCVRYGYRWFPQAIVTGNCLAIFLFALFSASTLSAPSLLAHLQNCTGLAGRFASRRSASLRFRLRFAFRPLCSRSLRFPLAIQDASLSLFLSSLCLPVLHRSSDIPAPHLLHWLSDQALGRLVSPSSTRYRASTDDLSTWSSPRGLTRFRDGNSLLWVGFTLRCLQRLSRPHFASQLCLWQDNCCTRGASIPVLSY